jgi:DNA-binding transcriptional LysR family regulator
MESPKMQLSDRIGRRLKLQDLHILMTVVQAGSMGKAAERLRTSQPNISRSISELEHALGVRLLDRHRQGIEPTEFGRALLDGGMTVFDELRQTVKKIEFLADPEAGEVRIGSVDPLAAGFVSSIVDRLSRRHPRIVFSLLTAQTDALHRDLLERTVDLLIARRFGALVDERLDFEFLFHDSYVVAAAAQSPWFRRRKMQLRDLVGEPWVLPRPESVPGIVLSDAMRAAGLDYPRTTVVTNSAEARMNLVATGRFLTIFSTSTLRYPTKRPGLKTLPVELPVTPIPVGVFTLKNRTLSPVTRLFIEHARELAKPLAQGR